MNATRHNIRQIVIDGDLTIYTASEWRDRLSAEIVDADEFELDLTRVSEIDSAGLQLLIAARKQAERSGGSLHIGHCSAVVLTALEFCRLTPDLINDAPRMPT